MAGKVFFSVSMSLDGFIAPKSPEDLMGSNGWSCTRRSRNQTGGTGNATGRQAIRCQLLHEAGEHPPQQPKLSPGRACRSWTAPRRCKMRG
jgi:hypothetical protein